MCGIVGFVSRRNIDFEKMLDSLKHRGPDGIGISDFLSDSGFNISLGHRRLSIIDVSNNSSQPFVSSDNNYAIIFNGEIYNFRRLKKDYLTDISMVSDGDTEVVIELFRKYGTKSFSFLQGMFAFSIYDKLKSKLYLCRDGLGIKPLYYSLTGNEVFFASEIAALRTVEHLDFSVCEDAIMEFFLNGFTYEPSTGYKNIKKVFPGSFIEISVGKVLEIKEIHFWKPSKKREHHTSSASIVQSVKDEYCNHLESDVPIGLCFSGGIDSSVLLSLGGKKMSAFFVDNQSSKYRENKEFCIAEQLAKSQDTEICRVELHLDNFKAEDLIKSIQHVSIKSEELNADFTFLPSELISRAAKESGFKVLLSGMGADELFLGYPRYRLILYERFYFYIYLLFRRLIKSSNLFSNKWKRLFSFFQQKDFILRYTNLIGSFQESELQQLLVNYEVKSLEVYRKKLEDFLADYRDMHQIKQAQILDLYGFLSHNFIVADKSSMQASVEMRTPLATPALFQESINSKISDLVNFRTHKIPLMSILKEKFSLKLFRNRKKGFNPSLDNLINGIGLDRIADLLNCDLLHKYIRKDFVVNLLIEHELGNNNSYRIYQLLYFKFWLQHNTSLD